MSTTLNVAHHQWAKRPPDERYETLEDLYAATSAFKDAAKERIFEASKIARTLKATEPEFEGNEMVAPGRVYVQAQTGTVDFTHYSFGQLCARTGAPAGYLRKLPAPLALQNVQYQMLTEHARRNDGDDRFKLLFTPPNGHPGSIRAFTGTGYGRIFDADVVKAIIRMNERLDNVWQVPLEAYGGVNSKAATTLYASDHDMFAFLTNENRLIDLGHGREARKGIIISNSEVGDGALDLWSFGYDRTCRNRFIWGPRHVQRFSMRHSQFAPEKFLKEVVPALSAYADAGVGKLEAVVKAARSKSLGASKEEVLTFLRDKGFTKTAGTLAITLAENGFDDDGVDIGSRGDPTNLWDVYQGLTAYARGIEHQDTRLDFDQRAGRLLDLVEA